MKELPQYQRLLLAVLLDDAKDGHEVRQADLKQHYTHAACRLLGSRTEDNQDVFETTLQGLVDCGLAGVHAVKGRDRQSATVTPAVSAQDYLDHVAADDSTLFKEYLDKLRKALEKKRAVVS